MTKKQTIPVALVYKIGHDSAGWTKKYLSENSFNISLFIILELEIWQARAWLETVGNRYAQIFLTKNKVSKKIEGDRTC